MFKSAKEKRPEGGRLACARSTVSSEAAVLVRGRPRDRDNDAISRNEAIWCNGARQSDSAPVDRVVDGSAAELQTVIYLDTRAFTRHCVGRWLQSSLKGFKLCLLPDPEQIKSAPIARDQVHAVIINTGPQHMSSGAAADVVSRINELLPAVPVVVLSDYEDAESVRQAFELGVRGYIPTSLASEVAIGAMQLVCVGGTFAPAAALLSQGDRPQAPPSEPPIKGFTQRQAQILDCLRRGMANKLIAYELNMRESTVKVHVRNIMKKLKATNRTQVVYLTRDSFREYQRA